MQNSSTNANLGFGFNDTNFSDRVLHIEVMADFLDFNSRRMDLEKENGDETAHSNDSNSSTVIIKVETLHINSLILAGKSIFFYKLFKNGMRESQQKDVTLGISVSEEVALMDILEFMYSNTLRATTTLDLLSVLMVADKFEVTSCMSYCSELLEKKPMSLEYANLYLELPSSLLMAEEIQPLLDATKRYLVGRYTDLTESQKEMMDLPLCPIEVVLGNDGFHADSEDDVFEFILKWARAHYPELKERREILTERLVKCICFSYMSCSKLKEVLVCPDFDHEQVSKLVLDALFLKDEVPYLQQIHDSKDVTNTKCSSIERIYKYQPIQVVRFQGPRPRCRIYFDLKKEECENPLPDKTLYSPSFCLGGRSFYLSANCGTHEYQHTFGLFLFMTKESESCTVDFEFSLMKKSSNEFERKWKGKIDESNLTLGLGLFKMPGITWTYLMEKDSEFFIDGILRLQADLLSMMIMMITVFKLDLNSFFTAVWNCTQTCVELI